ncbi:MAG: IS66 family insertion sequence element accessory protein TnpB [Candidatus Geothermincolia bacterium]
MLSLPATVRIWLCAQPTDLRKSFDSLAAIVRDALGGDPLSGEIFVFRNKSADRIKLLLWEEDGFSIWYKKQASDCTHPCPFTGNPGHTDNLASRPLTAGGVGSHQESSLARRRLMSGNDSVLAPPRARRTTRPQRSIVSGVC